MRRISIAYHNELESGRNPVPYVAIDTHMGYLIFSEKEMELNMGSTVWVPVEQSPRLITPGSFERTIQQYTSDVVTSWQRSNQKQHTNIDLDNGDLYISLMTAKYPFIGRPIFVFLGFETVPQSEHPCMFKGRITEISALLTFGIEAEEQ
jgi:hypothetical protein